MNGEPDQPGKANPPRHRELALRTASALVMATVACLATYAGVIPFTLMMAAGCLILAWEWRKLIRGDSHAWFWSAFGVLYLGLPILGLVWFRADTDLGLMVIFFLFMIVWSADTAAYFTGRAIGGPKLAPSISPGKTWAGFAGGLITPTLLATGFALWLGNTSAIALGAVGAILAVASQMGDLAESAIKRKFHVKDSGNILPGHGGLFDRVDGLIGASIAAGVIAALRSLHEPGKALLIWP